MKGHKFHNGSSLQDWTEHELSHSALQDQEELIDTDLGDRNLSLRMPTAMHLMLARIAERLGRSKSAVSEEISTLSVRDVYRQFDLPRLTQADLEEFAIQIEKPTPEKAPATKKTGR